MQQIGLKTTVRIDRDPNAAAAASGQQPAASNRQLADSEPEKKGKRGKKSVVVEEGNGSTAVAPSEPAKTQGTVMTQARVEQPPLGNTRIHIQEALQVQEIRDTRTRIRIHESHQAGVEVAPGVVVHQQAVSPDPHGRTRVTVTGGETSEEGGQRAASGRPAGSQRAAEESEPKRLGAGKKRRGKRGGKRAKRGGN